MSSSARPARIRSIGLPVAEARVEPEQPFARGVVVVDAAEVRPDELEQVDALGIQRVDALALEPAGDSRAADAEQVGDGGARSRRSSRSDSIFRAVAIATLGE